MIHDPPPTLPWYSQTIELGYGSLTVEGSNLFDVQVRAYRIALGDGWKPRRHWWQFWRMEVDPAALEEAERLLREEDSDV